MEIRRGQPSLKWLLGQYDLIDQVARDAGDDDVPMWELRDGQIIGADPRFQSMIIDRSAEPTPSQRLHIALHDPRTARADLSAKRAIVALMREDTTAAGQHRLRNVIWSLGSALPAELADLVATSRRARG